MEFTLDIQKIIDASDFLYYQAIYQMDNWTIIGNEVFLRSTAGNYESILDQARKEKKLFELETRSIMKLLEYPSLHEITSKELLFIKMFPSTILNSQFPCFINKLVNDFPSQINKIVFEVIGTEKISNMPLLKERINFLKSLNFIIAIDDIGTGWSSLSAVLELEPKFMKINHYFSINLAQSPLKQQMIKSLINYAQSANITVILEGIENAKDLAAAKYLGIHSCQGFLLDKPKPLP